MKLLKYFVKNIYKLREHYLVIIFSLTLVLLYIQIMERKYNYTQGVP